MKTKKKKERRRKEKRRPAQFLSGFGFDGDKRKQKKSVDAIQHVRRHRRYRPITDRLLLSPLFFSFFAKKQIGRRQTTHHGRHYRPTYRVFTEFYLILPCFTELNQIFTERYRILPNFTEFNGFLWSFTGFNRLMPNFIGFYRILPDFTRFYLTLLSFTEFNRVLWSFIEFNRVLLHFTSFY